MSIQVYMNTCYTAGLILYIHIVYILCVHVLLTSSCFLFNATDCSVSEEQVHASINFCE